MTPLRTCWRLSILALAWAACAPAQPTPGGAAQVTAEPEDPRPNVLFLVLDDLNDWIGALGGHPDALTPNLDRLAQRGVLFTNAVTSAPECNPSRTSILLGLSPRTSGVYENHQPWPARLHEVPTLPGWFLENGYEVVRSGKVFHSRTQNPASWSRRLDEPAAHSMLFETCAPGVPNPQALPTFIRPRFFYWHGSEAGEEHLGDYGIASEAVAFLEADRPADAPPFFLGVGLNLPHLPWCLPRTDLERLSLDQVDLPEVPPNDLEDLPPAGRRLARDPDHAEILRKGLWREAVRAYLAASTIADRQVGRILDALSASRYAENTIIVLWSDHGFHLGEKAHWRKGTLWSRSARVPLIVVAPGVTTPGARSHRAVSLMSLYPTLVELAGLPARPQPLEGESLVPLLRDPEAAMAAPAVTHLDAGTRALRTDRWAYIRYSDGGEELYDMESDPHQWRNLASAEEHQDLLRELRSSLP